MCSAPLFTEPDCGTDLQAIRTASRRRGDIYVINGTKTWISNGIHGQCFALLVKTDRPIEIEARAAHHIGPEDLTKGVSGSLWKPYLCYNEPIAFIAHNSKFEASFWPEAPAPCPAS